MMICPRCAGAVFDIPASALAPQHKSCVNCGYYEEPVQDEYQVPGFVRGAVKPVRVDKPLTPAAGRIDALKAEFGIVSDLELARRVGRSKQTIYYLRHDGKFLPRVERHFREILQREQG